MWEIFRWKCAFLLQNVKNHDKIFYLKSATNAQF